MNLKAIFCIAFFIGILSIGIYFLNKISTRKVNSFNRDPNNNLAQSQTERFIKQQNSNRN